MDKKMHLEALDAHSVIGIDFDGTLVQNPRSAILQQYILDHPDKTFHIVTFRTHNLFRSIESDLQESTRRTGVALTLKHFAAVHAIPPLIFERRFMFDDGTEYHGWKALTCEKIGCTAMVDDMHTEVGPHCLKRGIVIINPNEGYEGEPATTMEVLINFLMDGPAEYGEVASSELDALAARRLIVWREHKDSPDGYLTWPPNNLHCWVELKPPADVA